MKIKSYKTNLDVFNDSLAEAAGLKTKNREKGLCVECSRNALEHCSTDAGRREVAITGMCEECFDGLFK